MRSDVLRGVKGDVPDDDELLHVITERIDEDPAFVGTGRNRTSVAVDVEDGFVTLTGVVRTAMDRRRADIIARALGASGVDNRLRIAADVPGGGKRSRVA